MQSSQIKTQYLQHGEDAEHKYFTDYIQLLDVLVSFFVCSFGTFYLQRDAFDALL